MTAGREASGSVSLRPRRQQLAQALLGHLGRTRRPEQNCLPGDHWIARVCRRALVIRQTVDNPIIELRPIGRVESPLVEPDDAPRQGDEGAPSAWLVFTPEVEQGLSDLRVGDRVIVLTWLHRARREVLTTHPRGDPNRPPAGVFSTRSQDRPNPIGLHPVEILAIEGTRVLVGNLEAIDQTPIVDIKPELGPPVTR